jgi:NADPH:quinone reductase
MLQTVKRSTVIDAPIERVWAVLRDFNSHDQWHAVVASSDIEGGKRSDQVGCVRSFTLKDGNQIREQLLALDEHKSGADCSFKSTYCIVQATVPLQRYVATVTLKRVTDSNRTLWLWESSFATPPGMERELHDLVATGVYEAGFAGLREHLARGADLRPGQAIKQATGPALPLALPVPNRQVVVPRYGDASVLTPQPAECPAPGPGELRIRQLAVGVNYLDVYLRKGWIPGMLAAGTAAASVPGMEAAGTVLDVGSGVTSFMPGDRVAYLHATPGAYCTVRCLPTSSVVRLPPAIEAEVAAALLLKGLTADMLVHDLGHIKPGTRLLLHAAAGGVGLLVAAWARRLGATVIGTVSSDAKAAVARDYGCQHVIVTSQYRFAADVHSICGGADVIVDGLGAAAFDENLAALAPCGHWISLGQATGALPPLQPDVLVHKSATFSRPVVMAYTAPVGQLQARAQRLWAALADGSVRLPPIERYTLDAAAQAHQRLESRGSVGALVLVC